MHRRDFLSQLSFLAAGSFALPQFRFSDDNESEFARHLKPVGRALEMEGFYVWCNSPIMADDGKVHVFFSRWDAKKGMGGWLNGCEICRAVAEKPEGPYRFAEVVLSPRPGMFDASTCHNPSIKKVDGKYALFYMGSRTNDTDTKRVGLATADRLEGPWKRNDKPLLEAGKRGEWDDHCTTNPSFVKHPNGQYWLYYKGWNTRDFELDSPPIRGNRKYGLAIADKLEGPYTKHDKNPLVDFSSRGNNTQLEDAFVWYEKKRFKMIARDMGYYNHENGLLLESKDGIQWEAPKIAYYAADRYIHQPPAPAHLKRYGRFERPQILFIKDKPAYLFTASQGGRYGTASAFIFKIS